MLIITSSHTNCSTTDAVAEAPPQTENAEAPPQTEDAGPVPQESSETGDASSSSENPGPRSVSESGNQTVQENSEGGIAAQISLASDDIPDDIPGDIGDDYLDIEENEDEDVSLGSGFIYDDEVITEIFSDRFGAQRARASSKKEQMIGKTTDVGGQVWTVRVDVPENTRFYDEFIELGIRSNTVDYDCLPQRQRTRTEVLGGTRSSPRYTPKTLSKRDESKAIHSLFMTLYPVNWRRSLLRLNKHLQDNRKKTRQATNKNTGDVSAHEYWKFIGLLLLATVQSSGGMKGVFHMEETEGIISRVPATKYMNESRFKWIKKRWMSQFELPLDDAGKEANKWWPVGYLVHGFNMNRQQTVASSRVKTLDESMSAFRPQTTKTGNLPNISFILRKPEPLGTELKTVASKGSNGPIIWAEVQEGKTGMKNKQHYSTYGATCACVLRLAAGTKDGGQKPDPLIRNLFYGDSWFASFKTAVAVTEELNCEFLGPIKTNHAKFPKSYLESEMKDWPPGTHMVLETTSRGKAYYAIGYKYNMKKVLCFIATEGAGHTLPGDPYEAKWMDANGRTASRLIPRPHILSEYFKHSNQIDKHNHVRQAELAIEKNVVTECGFFRLFCTYLGITVTDSWKLYKDGLGGKHVNKHISILSFANVLCKSFLLNDYKQKSNESAPKPTLRCLEQPHSKKSLTFPTEIATASPTNNTSHAISSLGSGSGHGLVQIGNGKYVPSSFDPHHKDAVCIPTQEYVSVQSGSFSDRRKKRGKCRVCKSKNTCYQCSACQYWICNSANNRNCFFQHQQQKMAYEREDFWQSLQKP